MSSMDNDRPGSHRLPIFHDDLNFRDRPSIFSDLQQQMDDDFERMGLGSGLARSHRRPGAGWGSGWDDDIDSLCKDFFELRPRNPKVGKLSRGSKDDFGGSRESLDDEKAQSLFIENPETKTRMFQISFNVQDYKPEDISVKVVGDTLAVEAKHVDEKGGNRSVREFNRKIGIPKEVDPDKLSSSMSNDGILTIKAPVPPKYQSITASEAPSKSLPAPLTSISIDTSGHTLSSAPLQQHAQPPSFSASVPSYQAATAVPAPDLASAPGGSVYEQNIAYNPANTALHGQAAYNPQAAPSAFSPPPPPQTGQQYMQGSYPMGVTSAPPISQPRMSAPVPQMGVPPHTLQQPMPGMMSPPPPPPPQSQAMYYQQLPTQTQAFPSPPMPPADLPLPPQPVEFVQQQSQPSGRATPPLDTPVYTDTPTGRRMDLVLYLGPPYTPDDILVKVDGKTLLIEALHEEKKDKKTSKASMSREFELAEDINPQTVQANLTNDGKLKLAAMAPLPVTPSGEEPPAPATTTSEDAKSV